jgi:hypothetical protein
MGRNTPNNRRPLSENGKRRTVFPHSPFPLLRSPFSHLAAGGALLNIFIIFVKN